MTASGLRHARSATAVGVIAIFLWSCLALLSAFAAGEKLHKRQVLGAVLGLAPLISTVLLIVVGHGHASPTLLVPALLIIAGAVIATAQAPEKAPATRSIISHE